MSDTVMMKGTKSGIILVLKEVGDYVTLKKDFFTKVNLKINQDTKNYFIILIKKGEDSNAYVTQSKRFLVEG